MDHPDNQRNQAPPLPIDPSLWRDYLLLTSLGVKPGEADEISAVRLDWLLAIHGAVQEVRNRE